MAAVDIYVNETTRHADVILPPTTALERDHYDLVFHGLAVRNTARFTPAVFEKPRTPATTGRSSATSRCASTARLDQQGRRCKTRLRAARPADRQPDLRWSGCCCAAASQRRHPAASSAATPRASTSGRCGRTLPGRLQTQDQRIDLAPPLVLDDLDRLRADPRPPAGDELLLIGRRHQRTTTPGCTTPSG